MMRRIMAVGLGSILCLLVVGVARAQRVDGTLRGDVHDQTGAVVEGAKVTVTNQGTGISQTIDSTSAGTYVFPNLLGGLYTVTVEKSGFEKFVNRDIQVRPNQITEADAHLTIGASTTTVEVTAGAETVQATTATLTNNFDANQLVGLPVQAQNGGVLNLAILAPGTTTQGGGVLGVGGSIGGARPRMNNFTVDGLDDNDVGVTGPMTHVVADSISEFNLITNEFSAEYGHSAGGQFSIVTKSGTNDLHGTGFLINNNRNYNAFDNIEKGSCAGQTTCVKPRFDYNILGGSVGGPVIKNKIFFFGAYQRQFAGFAGSSNTMQAPLATGKTDLIAIAQDAAVVNILNAFPTAPVETLLPNGQPKYAPITVTNVNSGVSKVIHSGDLSLLAPSFLNETDWNVAGDVNLGKHQIRMRYIRNNLVQPNLSNPPIATLSGDTANSVHKASISDVVPITSSFINDFRLGYSRVINSNTVPSAFKNFPDVHVNDFASFQVALSGPSSGGQNVYQLLDQMSLSKGRHTFKWGAEVRRWIAPSGFLPRERGEWQYHTMQQLVNDYVPTDFAKRGAGTGSFDGNQSAAFGFVQDDWKVTPRLTLNLGLRYEWIGIANAEKLHKLNEISSLPGTPLQFRIPKSDTNNWMPRFGAAWDPLGNGKWAVRGGFGVSFDVQAQNFAINSQPPQLQSEQDPDITCGLPNPPVWCANFVGGNKLGQGFLAGGGLLSVNIPPANQAQARAATAALIGDHVLPKVYTWTLSVQHELSKRTSLEVRYLGTRGLELMVQRQLNARSAFDNGATALPTYFSAAAVPTKFAANAPTLANFQSFIFRPYAAAGFLGSLTSFPGDANSIYHSGSVDFIHRMGIIKGLYFRANYTFAHNIDTGTNELFSSLIDPRRAQDGNNIEQERGRSVLDIRHKGAISWVYELPKFASSGAFKKALMNGWEYNGTVLYTTGQPATARSTVDSNGNKDSAGDRTIFNPTGDPHFGTAVTPVCNNGPAGASYVDATCDPNHADDKNVGGDPTPGAGAPAIVGYLANNSKAAFVQAGVGARSNVGRNTLTTPGRSNFDMAVFKNTYITEHRYIQLRAEFFNVFNHRQYSFSNPGVFAIAGIDTSAINFGGYVDVTNKQFLDPTPLNGGSRQIQLGIKFVF